jgi:hypothetical protein
MTIPHQAKQRARRDRGCLRVVPHLPRRRHRGMPRLPLHRSVDRTRCGCDAPIVRVRPWLAWPGIAIGLTLIVGSLEFVGPFEEKGWKLAGTMIPIAYTAWSLWLVISGVVLLIA